MIACLGTHKDMLIPFGFAVLIYLLVVEAPLSDIAFIAGHSDNNILFSVFLDLNNLIGTSPLQN